MEKATSPPEGYAPPCSSDELEKRYKAGERFFALTKLPRADFSGCTLADADLRGADLSEANLWCAHLAKTDFSSANVTYWPSEILGRIPDVGEFVETNLSGAVLLNADLSEADLSGVDLSAADLEGVNLRGAILARANLARANLSGANLSQWDSESIMKRARPIGADLYSADLSGTNLVYALLKGAKLTQANLENADLRGVFDLQLDSNFIRGARFSPKAADPWSVLRRTYTGSRLAFHLLLLIVFLIPYVAKTMFWVGINRSQITIMELTIELKKVASDLKTSNEPSVRLLGQTLEETISRVQPCLASNCTEWQIWQLIIAMDRGLSYWMLAVALVLYNLCRGLLTWQVGLLRDEEERSHYSPAWSEYRRLIWPHRIVTVLVYVAIGSFLVHLWGWLFGSVWLPR